MTYECLGAERFRCELIMFRDCKAGNTGFDGSAGSFTDCTVSIYRGESAFPFRNIDMGSPEIENFPIESDNPCLEFIPDVCVQQGKYTIDLDLSFTGESYYIIYQRCCRNPTINNIRDPQRTGSTLFVEITAEAQQLCNSSPVFNSLPPLVLCTGDALEFDHSASDADGNELVYSFCAPLLGGARNDPAPDVDLPPPYTEVEYINPYSADNPLGGSPEISIDPQTGLITGTPDTPGQFSVGVCVEEYQNGMLLSKVSRDVQFNVVPCKNIFETDLSANAVVSESYLVFNCNDSIVSIENNSTPVNDIFNVRWEFGIDEDSIFIADTYNLNTTVPGYGEYNGLMIINSGTICADTAEFKLFMVEPIEPEFNYVQDFCLAKEIEFDFFNGNEEIETTWDFNDGDTAEGMEVSHLFIEPGEYNVKLKTLDPFGCRDSVSQTISWFPIPDIGNLSYQINGQCAPLDVDFGVELDIVDDYKVKWFFGDGDSSDVQSPTHAYLKEGTFLPSVTVTNPQGCIVERDFGDEILIDFNIYVPNTFSPVTNNLNDKFCVFSFCDLPNFDFTIYDRWGIEMYRTTDVNSCWNGYKNNRMVNNGVYTWVYSYTNVDNEIVSEFGTLTLIR